MTDTTPCDHHVQHRIQDTTIDGDDATDQWICDECGEEWTQTRGVTVGEAMQESLEDVIEECQRLEARAEQLRGEGKETEAEILERLAELLAKEGMELAEKRRKMPFGLDSAQGFGEVMDNPAISFAEEMQRDADSDDE